MSDAPAAGAAQRTPKPKPAQKERSAAARIAWLGAQARRAVERLLQALDQADVAHGGELLAGQPPARVYEAAMTVILRLLFLRWAQARGRFVGAAYGALDLGALAAALRREAARADAPQRLSGHAAWAQLCAGFRLLFAGRGTPPALPPRGGLLFDPDRFPFLEGRRSDAGATAPPIDDGTVLQLLDCLLLADADAPAARPKVAFAELEIEDLGPLYEDLLGHTAQRADEPLLVLAARCDRRPKIALATLERLAQTPPGDRALVRYLQTCTGRAAPTLRRALHRGAAASAQSADQRVAKGPESEDLHARLLPFLPLVAAGVDGTPALVARGRLYVTAGSERRRSSTYYTPPELTVPICTHTLEPQCFRGADEGWPRSQWQLRSPAELVALQVCDPACGAGAFLLQACRYLATRLLDAGAPDPLTAPAARRLVASRCLYGVDKNPLAVEMAKLSLWLLAADEDDPFTWLDHALRCGDSLIGLPVPGPQSAGAAPRRRPASAPAGNGVLAELVPLHWPLAFPHVFGDRGGFDAIVGNPPYLGGLRLSRELSHSYNLYLCSRRKGTSRKADLVAHFIRRMYELLRPQGTLGFLSTKTATEGVTRKAGLWWVLRQGGTIYRAQGPFAWPGAASVQAVVVHLRRGGWPGPVVRDGRPCAAINDQLATTATQGESQSEHRLRENKGLCYEGSVLLGTGFLITPELAQQWIASDPRNREVLFPYVSGKEFNHTPTLAPQRWAIRFGERSLEEARSYAAPFTHLLSHVYPERIGKNASRYPRMVEQWWKYWHERHVLYAAVARVRRVLIRSRVCARHMLGFVPPDWVYGDAVIVFALDTYGDFALLQSSLHEAWAAHYTSTLRTDLRYVQSTCFESFARPAPTAELEAAGRTLYYFRQQLMQERAEGLTAIYQRFHDPTESADALRTLRTLHTFLDQAVAAAYGWAELDLGHAFRATRNGPRYTLSDEARDNVLARLLALNHARHAAPQ